MAKGVFEKMLEKRGKKNIELRSAGTAAPGGMKVPQIVEEVMGGEGVDMSGHRATSLNKELIDEADLILVMEKQHRRCVLKLCPEAGGKMFLLKEFSPNLEERFLDIPDPIGKPLKTYQKIFQEIKACLQEFVKKVDWYLSKELPRGS